MSTPPAKAFQFREGGPDPYRDGETRRFYDPRFKAFSVMVLPGNHYVSSDPQEMIVTLLGSCVAACMRDPVAGVGGLNHFLLPESESGSWGEASAVMRYGNHAMETLINDIIKRGGDRRRFEVKVFGGGNVIRSTSATPVGSRNVEFTESYLESEGFKVAAKHLGGELPRRIHYFPVTGHVKMLLLKRSPDKDLFNRERDYGDRLKKERNLGDVELFD